MASPWELDPIVQPAVKSAAPWEQDPIVTPVAPPPAAPPPAMSVEGNPMVSEAPVPASNPTRAVQLGTQDVGRGLANLAGTPFDLTNMLANLGITAADKVAEVFGGNIDYRLPTNAGGTIADTFVDGMGAVGMPAPIPWEDRSGSEKMVGNVIDFGTQAAAGGGGLAMQAGKRFAETGPLMPSMFDKFLRPYATNPGRTVVGDTAAGLGSGVGVAAADTLAPDSPIAQLIGSLIGGVGGATTAGLVAAPKQALETALSWLPDPNIPIDPTTNMPVSRRTSEHAARLLQNQAVDARSAAETLHTRINDAAQNGEPLPTTGIASDDIGLIAMEKGMRAKDSVPFQVKDQALKDAASENLTNMRIPGADQGAAVRRAETARNERLAPATAEVQGAEGAVAAATAARQAEGAPLAVRRGDDRKVEASRALDTAVVDEGYIPARTQKNEMFDAVDPDRTDLIDAAPVVDAARRVRDGINALGPQGQQMPAEFVQRLEALAPDIQDVDGVPTNVGGTGEVAVGDLVDLRKYLSTARANARQSGNFELADNIGDLQIAVNEATAAAPGAADAVANYRGFADRYRPGPGDEGAKLTKEIDRDSTRSKTPPEKTASRFLSAPEKAAALDRILTGAPSEAAGRAAARDYLLSDYASSVMNPDGSVNAIRSARWAEKNAAVLDQFPTVRQEVDDMVASARRGEAAEGAATERLRGARAGLKNTEAEIDASAAGTLLRAENGDPRNVARRIFSGDTYGAERELDEINTLLGADESARNGWKDAVVEVLDDMVRGTNTAIGGPEGPVMLAKVQKMIKQHEAALSKVFTPAEMNTLRRTHKMLEPLGNLSRQGIVGSATEENRNLVNGLEAAVLAYTGNAITTGMIMRRLKVVANLMPGLKEMTLEAKMKRLIARAALDPRLGALLLEKEVKVLKGPTWNKTLNRLLGVTEAGRDDEEEPE